MDKSELAGEHREGIGGLTLSFPAIPLLLSTLPLPFFFTKWNVRKLEKME